MLLEADSVCPVIYYLMDWSNNLAKVGPGNGNKVIQPKIPAVLTYNDIIGLRRPAFRTVVRQNMGSCIVHSLSFADIKREIAKSFYHANPIPSIKNVAKIVIANDNLNTNQDVLRSINDLDNATNYNQGLDAVKRLITVLNSVEANLRSANVNFCWNTIIGEDYDPENGIM